MDLPDMAGHLQHHSALDAADLQHQAHALEVHAQSVSHSVHGWQQ